MKNNISDQKLSVVELVVLEYLNANKMFFEPQKVLAKRIGYSREHTNKAIKSLRDKGLVFVSKAKNLNRRLKLITLSGKVWEFIND